MTLPSRGRDDVIFGAKEKKKDNPLAPELQQSVNDVLTDCSATADMFKTVGNACFGAGNFSTAIKLYTKALELDPTNEVLLSNRSAAYVQSPLLAGPSLALKDAEKAIALKPTWFKAHLRRADALFAAKKVKQALEAYETVLSLDPTCATAIESKRWCQRELLEAGEAVSPTRGAAPVAETCPYNAATHKHERRFVTDEERREAEKHLDTDVLLNTWSKDTVVEEGVTACKKRTVDLQEADRVAGKSYKEQLLNNFRKKVTSDEALQRALEERKRNEALAGEGVDLRRDADSAKRVLTKGTDGVGLAISTDAFKSLHYESRVW